MNRFVIIFAALVAVLIVATPLSAQIVLKQTGFGGSESNDGSGDSFKHSHTQIRARYAFDLSNQDTGLGGKARWQIIPEILREEDMISVENFNFPLKTGAVLTEQNFPGLLRSDQGSVGISLNSSSYESWFLAAEIVQNTAETRAGKDSEFMGLIGLYDYFLSEKDYLRFGFYYSTNSKQDKTITVPIIAYYNENGPFRYRITPVYLRAYYDFESSWQLNFKVNSLNRSYWMDEKIFGKQFMSYRATEINTGLLYSISESVQIGLDTGYRLNQRYVFEPVDIDDRVDTLHLKDEPYLSVYFMLGPRDVPE